MSQRNRTRHPARQSDRRTAVRSQRLKPLKLSPSLHTPADRQAMQQFYEIIRRAESLSTAALNVDIRLISSANAAALRQTKEDLLQQLEKLDNLDDPTVQVQTLRQDTLVQLSHCSAALAPIRRLPQELLSLVFIHSMSVIDPFRGACFFLGTIIRVCSWWKQVALDTPDLWTYIDYNTLLPRDPHFASLTPSPHLQLSIIPRLLRMSGALPLTIRHNIWINDNGLLAMPDDDGLRALLTDILPHANHWGSIQLGGTGEAFAEIPVVELPLLRSATVMMNARDVTNALNFLSRATELTELFLCAPEVKQSLDAVRDLLPSLPRLTSFILKTYIIATSSPASVPRQPHLKFSWGTLQSVLDSCRTTLVHLELRCGVDVDAHSTGVVDMIALRQMRLIDGANNILSRLRAPMLIEMTLKNPDPGADNILTALAAFISGSRLGGLQRLSFVNFSLPPDRVDAFVACLAKLESLVYLCLGNHAVLEPLLTEQLLRRLAYTEDESPLLPHLKSVKLTYRRRRGMDNMRDAVIALMRSRWESPRVPHLRHVLTDIPGINGLE